MIPRLLFAAAALTSAAALTCAQDIPFTETHKTINYPVQMMMQGQIDGDGYPDFLFGLYDSLNIYTLKSDGSGGYVDWTIPTEYCPALPLAFGDLARNGKNDLLASKGIETTCANSPYGSFATYMNDYGAGTFSLFKQFQVTSPGVQAVVLADFTGDEKLDAVIVDGSALELEYGDGYGNFYGPYAIAQLAAPESPASMTGNYYNLVAGDFDGNGCPDVAWTEAEEYGERGFLSQIKVAFGDCRGNFAVTTPYNVEGEFDNLQSTDLDRDGVTDLVATLDEGGQGVVNPTVQLSYGHADRSFTTKQVNDPTLNGPIQVADFNGDAYPDIAYAASNASGNFLKILEGGADQSFTNISEYTFESQGPQTEQMISGDFNRDGKTDLAMLFPVQGDASSYDFTILNNASAYPNGACAVPVGPGVNICSPGATSGTTVNVLAAGNDFNPTVYMEVWVDGEKKAGFGSTNTLRTTLNLPAGTHQFEFYAIDAAGIRFSGGRTVTVQ